MLVCFQLTMPNVGSWNGKWTGEGRPYFIIKKLGKAWSEKLKAGQSYFHYNFGDGWSAGVTLTFIDGKESRKRRKASVGFCGYDWMVDSILAHGEIRSGNGPT